MVKNTKCLLSAKIWKPPSASLKIEENLPIRKNLERFCKLGFALISCYLLTDLLLM